MKAGNAMVVTIRYALKGEEGEVIESNTEEEPLHYLHGAGNIIEGLEDGLDGLESGEEFDITVEPKYGYGQHQPALISTISVNRFPDGEELKDGQVFTLDSPQGPRLIRILELRENEVKVDGNHELAGKTLRYVGKVLSVREATEDELGNGYVRDSGV